ncbi:hypothetical protein OsI_33958 [Oryza sativa Indica Group]|uniref:Uncharacterized protein n=1 Tax=Oryza sativa subsp. indica TaxID=39946 RepID=A2Z8C1_ORYSI|nr:hypothetical protein OsI_33958 [Oryza sativa Indica Group]
MAFLDGLYGSRRRMATAKGAGAAGRRRSSSAVAAPRPVRQLYWKVRSRLRSSSKRHAGGAAAARFGYDLQSYSRNFDDGVGLVVSGHRF